MQDALDFIEQKENLKTANKLARVIYPAQTDWLEYQKNQQKLTYFFKPKEI